MGLHLRLGKLIKAHENPPQGQKSFVRTSLLAVLKTFLKYFLTKNIQNDPVVKFDWRPCTIYGGSLNGNSKPSLRFKNFKG